MTCSQALSTWLMWGIGVPLPKVTFDLCHATPSLTLAHPNPSTSVNELEDPGAIEGSVWLEGSLSALVIVCRWCRPGSGSCHCVGGVVEWHCVRFDAVEAVLC